MSTRGSKRRLKVPKTPAIPLKLIKVRALASSALLKISLKAPLGIKSYTLPPPFKVHKEERQTMIWTADEASTSPGDRDEDFASPHVLARSIAGLLTAASMYVGIEDIHRAEQIGTNEEESSAEPGDDNAEVKADEEVEEGSIFSGAPSFSGAQSRRSTLFELSIVPNTEMTSVQQSRGRNWTSRIMSKLKSKFNLQEDEQLVKEYSCWLLRDVLIQGHIYLTSKNLLFFAFLYKADGAARLTGNLSISTSSISISGKLTRYWAVLKDHTLSLYNSSTDLYFPVLTLDLRYVTKVQHCKQNGVETRKLSVVTDSRTYSFFTDNEHFARSWASAIKKQVFTTQNSDNDSMSIKIPLCNIVDLEDHAIMEKGMTLRIRTMESSETFALDDYFFMFFNNAGNQLTDIIKAQLADLEMLGSQVMIKYGSNSSPIELSGSSSPVQPVLESSFETRGRSDVKIKSRSFVTASRTPPPIGRGCVPSVTYPLSKSPSKVRNRFRTVTDSLKLTSPKIGKSEDSSASDVKGANTESTDGVHSNIDNNSSEQETFDTNRNKTVYWNPKPFITMRSMWNALPIHYAAEGLDLFAKDDELLMSDPVEAKAADKRFKEHFSLTDDESLIASYYTYLNRNMPWYGKVYLGKSVICFRSLLPGSKTKMILPLRDIENSYKEKGFRFGYFGLVIVIHGHEELFFEFALQRSRDDAEYLILKVIDTLRPLTVELAKDNDSIDQRFKNTHIQDPTNDGKLRLFEDKINSVGYDIPIMFESSPYFKTTITPKKIYTFGLLTIGSRGDVQPYIALGKGLMQEGHKVIIITHIEFGDWIKSHGIEFRSIAGDPTELMALMVQHGSMNVGLIRDATSKFRDWIRDLLTSSWEACNGIDVLIESPSAMAGIHVAEALQIPYFRAFTMPWTKTRSYPHAFIVPDQKRGGNYNYFTHVIFENIFWKGIHGQVNKWRVETLGLPKTNLEFLQQAKVPFLYNISPTIFPPSVDFSEWIKVTGYWFLNESSGYEPPQTLVDFIAEARANEKKIVYIGFGSIVVKDPAKMTAAVIEAVVKADVYCILNKGWSERLADPAATYLGVDLPPCIYNAGTVPHDWLFPQIDAAVHHGGSGTTGATMRAGLPSVIKPFFGDQYFYATRIEDIGAGVALKKLNANTLSRALKEVTTNSRIITKAKKIGLDISKEDGVATAISFIYSEMAYAKSLVKMKNHDNKQLSKDTKHIANDESWLML
ncbi:HCL619Cp [Eremothecium sinecaudum]|uniref:Sterol 3-beta-glucosyltransferase n=1 Tax=Eremothecium sinecaudum TaxID=45286 RepID=A0A120K1M6_9SACH|nr:HCL619Cp [Eremothecium sinecaudum]AMD19532.1 HCL619Cp [Eremothecium sinecaudum]